MESPTTPLDLTLSDLESSGTIPPSLVEWYLSTIFLLLFLRLFFVNIWPIGKKKIANDPVSESTQQIHS